MGKKRHVQSRERSFPASTACHPTVLCTPIQAHPFIWSRHLPKATCDPECLHCCEDKLKGGRKKGAMRLEMLFEASWRAQMGMENPRR